MERKKKIAYGIVAVIFIILGMLLERGEKAQVETAADVLETVSEVQTQAGESQSEDYVSYYFRNDDLLEEHYKKHGMEMGFASMEAYEEAASAVINNPLVMQKTEAEDGDYVYYVEETNEFVVVSGDGYIRTYFNPTDGLDYYNRQ